MIKIEQIAQVHDYNAYIGQPDEHPLVSVIHYEELPPCRHCLNRYEVYGLFLRDDTLVDLAYGCGHYDYDESALVCVAPGQTGGKEDNGERVALRGWALLFHPDLLRGTFLEEKMRQFTFFAYHVNEALHMTPEERAVIVDYLLLIRRELRCPTDAYRDAILVSLIDAVLEHCMRFFDRQFSTHRPQHNDILTRFERFLHHYFDTGRQLRTGLPSVQLCAAELCLSSNYFTDFMKKQTGLPPKEHIHRFVIARAKSLLMAGQNVSQVTHSLGFEYTQHFCRLFKKMEGCTPTEYLARKGKRE